MKCQYCTTAGEYYVGKKAPGSAWAVPADREGWLAHYGNVRHGRCTSYQVPMQAVGRSMVAFTAHGPIFQPVCSVICVDFGGENAMYM